LSRHRSRNSRNTPLSSIASKSTKQPSMPDSSHLARNAAIVILVIAASLLVLIVSTSVTTPRLHLLTIVNATLSIPGNQTVYSFYVPAGTTGVHLKGNFSATSFSGDKPEVFVMNPTQFNTLQGSNPADWTQYNYSSGGVMASSFDVQLQAGQTYYLVYGTQYYGGQGVVPQSLSLQTTVYLAFNM
jgi:hypothetical protein